MIIISILQMWKLTVCPNPTSLQDRLQMLPPSGSPFEVVAKHISFRVQLCGLEGNLLIDCVTSGKLFHFLLYRIVPTFQDCYEIRIRCYK